MPTNSYLKASKGACRTKVVSSPLSIRWLAVFAHPWGIAAAPRWKTCAARPNSSKSHRRAYASRTCTMCRSPRKRRIIGLIDRIGSRVAESVRGQANSFKGGRPGSERPGSAGSRHPEQRVDQQFGIEVGRAHV